MFARLDHDLVVDRSSGGPLTRAYARLREGRPRGGLRRFRGPPLPLPGRNPASASSARRSQTARRPAARRTDCPPFALLRRRTPGHAEDVVEVLIGPVGDGATGWPTSRCHRRRRPAAGADALALVPFRQIRERGFDVRDDGTPLSGAAARRDVRRCRWRERAGRAARRTTCGSRAAPSTSDDDAYAGDRRAGASRTRSAAARARTSSSGATFDGGIPGLRRAADALALFRRLLAGERGAYWTFVVHTGGRGRWSAPAPRCTCGCPAARSS